MILTFVDGAEWESWLEHHHATESEAWLRIAKRRSPVPGISISAALDGALCFGWIDGQRRANDADSFLQRYSPRRPRSSWSKINVTRFEILEREGRVRPAGATEAAAARADGRWAAAYESQRTATVPDDLSAELVAHPRALVAFDRLDRTSRYAVILDLLRARTPQRRRALLSRHIARLESAEE
ncbi:uncharacterized protein YdeI (YjbR/CyaY-like superfamily) [Brevibacterium sanguinis]|uniref:Uncharacterized protein YdeI (YjbR/CyaY-like superfamily) n=2 Tax=Brevibacterium TaxID=1696 RepID=A0A366IMZ4_9MICO|nr:MULTISPECIES: YdeI/OmpD-associated family protein [Brevibacterium]RBP66205.1 uncharacterized protein YdeI (YjbR/CyaY-like superfamily) [Brevibacterium sanguinis]RBP72856.1 uncharacterized protein YdeI (YjbR/CyaY-like superfamily) [Brevibacterium celere]